MSRRGTAILYAVTGVVTAVAVLASIVRWNTGEVVNRANYNRIVRGMPRAEVEALFGELTLRGPELVDVHNDLADIHSVADASWWNDGRHEIVVEFDGLGKAVGKSYSRNAGAGVLSRFVDWVGL